MPVKKEVGEAEGKGNGGGCSLVGEHEHWVLCLEAFISLAGGNLWAGLGGRFQQNISFRVCSFRVMVSTDWLVTWQFSHCSWFWLPHLVFCFSGPAAEIQLRPREVTFCLWLYIALATCLSFPVPFARNFPSCQASFSNILLPLACLFLSRWLFLFDM